MDRRSSSPEVLLELKERAVSLKKLGKTHQKIASILNIGHSTLRHYWKLYKSGGQVRTLGEYLKRWGFTPQKPKRRDYSQQPEQVKAWLDEEYPKLKRRAKAEGAEIYGGDETGVSNQDQIGRSYASKEPPVDCIQEQQE